MRSGPWQRASIARRYRLTLEADIGWRRLARTLLIAIALISPAHGQEPDPFDVGIEHTRAGRFDLALQRFEQARAQGDDSPRLHFNLGVVHYRLGHHDRARRAFTAASQDPELADLAHYNLGLVELAAGHETAARGWFRLTVERAADPGLRQLARSALGQPSANQASAVQTGLQVLRGHDSNVILPVGAIADAATSTQDHYWDLRAGAAGSLAGWVDGLGYHLNGLLMAYDEFDDADLGATEAGLDWRGPFTMEFNVGALTVGDRGYQRSMELRALAPLIEGESGTLQAEANATRLDALNDNAEPVEGWQYGLGLGYQHRFESVYLQASYRHLENRRRSSALSPPQDLVQLRALARWGRWSARVWTRYLHSRYEADRRDRAFDVGTTLGWAPWACCEALLEFTRQENDSTESAFSYVSERFGLGLRLQF